MAAKALLANLSFRVWLQGLALAAFALWSAYLLHAGYAWADAAWRAKALEAKIARLELELEIQREADAAEDRMRAELAAENEQQKKVIDAYLDELKNRPDKCLLGPDADRLQ